MLWHCQQGKKREAAHLKQKGHESWNKKMWIGILALKVSVCGTLDRSPHHTYLQNSLQLNVVLIFLA